MIKYQKMLSLRIVCCLAVLSLFTIPAFTQTTSKPIPKPKAGSTVKTTTAAVVPNWEMEVGPIPNIKVSTPNKQIFRLGDQVNMAALENGKIEIYQFTEDTQWVKTQTLEVPEVSFTTVVIKDLNNDQLPEIVGGTTDPGFIYIYQLDQESKWITKKDAKYIWSTISKMAAAHFKGNQTPVLIAQNKEGFLFVLKPSDTTLDLIWKSPAAWRPLDNLVAVDLDNDADDELVAVYKNGGIAILRSLKNALKSTWTYSPWGKILSVNHYDWDNNNKAELIMPTTQKMICIVSTKNKISQAVQEASDYVIEKIFFIKVQNHKYLLTTDTSGKTHISEYSVKSKGHWKEIQSFQTGRILEIMEKSPEEILLINQGLQMISLKKSLSY